ncbi:hypothetical protein E9840_11800 [Tissierella creatinini]|nr:hypothetical protein E9840_11800 [Tissierella creatinini]TJX60370.1 hypothetical protein E8P77_20295 [Soehngenia saccharolytica]
MRFIMVEGRGDPNRSQSYKDAVEALYGLSYTIKMSKKGETQPDTSLARLEDFTESLCGQIMHIGSYDDEPPTGVKLEDFIESMGYKTEMTGLRQHHEIYIGDPRKTECEKLKTVIRHPIIKK